jgi:hypothetical protein
MENRLAFTYLSLRNCLKGLVRRKVRWGQNWYQWIALSSCLGTNVFFSYLKGHHPLNSINRFQSSTIKKISFDRSNYKKKTWSVALIYMILFQWYILYTTCHRNWRPITTTVCTYILSPCYNLQVTLKILGSWCRHAKNWYLGPKISLLVLMRWLNLAHPNLGNLQQVPHWFY